MRHAVFLPPFDDFADPRRLVELAEAAEESGWDGFSSRARRSAWITSPAAALSSAWASASTPTES